jgi:protein TonB
MSYAEQAAVEPQEPGARLAVAFLAALALHAAALLAVSAWRTPEETKPPGEQEIVVDLAPAATEASSIEPAAIAPSVQTEGEVGPAPPPPEVVPEAIPAEAVPPAEPMAAEAVPAETVEAAPVETVETLPAEAVAVIAAETTDPAIEVEEVVARPPEETATARPLPAPVAERSPPKPKPPQKPAPVKREAVRRPAPAPVASAPSSARQGVASSSREDAGASAASADPNARNRFFAQISAAVRSRLRYPAAARAQGISGVAAVRFTVHRSGRVIDASLVRSSGHAALDQAAVATVAPGSTLPAAPEAVPQQQFTFTVPLQFNLR